MDGYTGTLENVAFGAGFEKYTDEWTDTDGTTGRFLQKMGRVPGRPVGECPEQRGEMVRSDGGVSQRACRQ